MPSKGVRSRVKQAKQLPRAYRPLTRKEKDAKKQYESYRRRRKCLGNKGFELKTRCKAQVFVLVKDKDGDRSHFWSSEKLSDSWPPNGMKLAADSNAREIPLKHEDAEPRLVQTQAVPKKRDVGMHNVQQYGFDDVAAPDSNDSSPCSQSDLASSVAMPSRSAQVKTFLDRFHDFSSQQATMWRKVRTTIGSLE